MALPTLTVQRGDGRLAIKDNPALYWELYCSFAVGGVVALYVIFTSTLSRMSLWTGVVVACGAILAGLLLLVREAASVIVLNQSDMTLMVMRWTLLKRSTSIRPLRDIVAAKIERKDNIDDASLLRPTLVLSGGATLPISNFWYKKDEASRAVVEHVNAFLAASPFGKNVA